eukprot:9498492-Pyramimonas_sp.AAC.1
MQLQRRRLGAAAGSSKRGRCLSTLLAMRLPCADPGALLPQQCVSLWLSVRLGGPQLRPSISLAWPATVKHLMSIKPEQRNRHVRGQLSTVMLYLLEAGWAPVSPVEWGAPNDGARADELPCTMGLKQWRQTAELHCGEGLADGVDTQSYRKSVNDLTHAKRGRQRIRANGFNCDRRILDTRSEFGR